MKRVTSLVIAHGATKRELLDALQAAQVPSGGPTLSVGRHAIVALAQDGAFTHG